MFEISNIDFNPLTGLYSTGALNAAGTRNAVSVAINASGVFQPGHKNIRAGVLNTAIPNDVLGGLQRPDIDAMTVAVETLIIAEYLARGRPLAGLALTAELTRIVTDALVANLGADIMDAGERGDFDILMARVTHNGGVPSRAKGAPTQLAFGNLPGNVAGDVTTILNEIRTERALWQQSTLLLNAPLLSGFAGGINTRQGNKHYQGNHTNNAGWLPAVAVPNDQVTPLHLVVAASRGVGTILNAGDPAGQLAQERAARSTAWREYAGAFSSAVYGSGLDAAAIKLSAMAAMCQGVSAYIEFWMATSNISRLLYDPVNGQVYITAHYRWRNGYNPFVEVTGFPAV